MTTWRARDMTEADCSRFKRTFEFVYKVTPFNKEMALYLRTSEGEPGGTVAMTSYQAMPLEMLYPGAWRDADPPEGIGSPQSWRKTRGSSRRIAYSNREGRVST